MHRLRALWPWVVATPLLLAGCGGGTRGDAGAPPEDMVDAFALRIQPILDANCVRCHGPGGTRGSSPLTGYDEVLRFVVPGDPGASQLLGTKSMTKYATDGDWAVLREWIAEGALRWAHAGSVAPAPEPGPPRAVGMRACLVCHGAGPQFAGWLQGAHGNRQDQVGYAVSPGTLDSVGFPSYYGDPGLRTAANCSATCHDPMGDGERLTAGLSGNVPRPVIGCESCHGGGANHFGTGPIPYPRPDFTRCGPCHDATFDHVRYHPEGDDVLEGYLASPHARSINQEVLDAGAEGAVRSRCSKCHTDQGSRLHRNVAGGFPALAVLDGRPSVAEAAPIQCRTCHDPHDPQRLLLPAAVAGDGVLESAEYRTCTACHQLTDPNGTRTEDGQHDPAVNPAGALDRIISDSHFDVASTSTIEGYVIDRADDRPCRNCHDQHASAAGKNRQWARSGHGGRILVAKEAAKALGHAAVFAAGATDTSAGSPAWTHYDWDHTFKADGSDPDALPDKDRADCQHCHTATGFRNYADSLIAVAAALAQDPAADTSALSYAPARNDFSHLAGWALSAGADGATAPSGQNELLYCWACHTSNKGHLRNPGPVTAPYPGAPVTYPDLAASNVCMPCHVAQVSGESVRNANGSFANKAFMNPHYLSGGGTLFTTAGYEYDADGDPGTNDYANAAYYKHDRIGLAPGATSDTGTRGPCVGCHMSGPEGHLLAAVWNDPADPQTVLDVATPVCAECHRVTDDGQDHRHTPEGLTESRRLFHESLEALGDRLDARGFYFQPSYPYFFREPGTTDRTKGVTNWLLDLDGDGVADEASGKPTMGAAFNYALLHHEPGAYAHNRLYTRRLIYDAIDWLDDLALNHSVAAALAALPDGTSYKAGAQHYLLGAQGGRP